MGVKPFVTSEQPIQQAVYLPNYPDWRREEEFREVQMAIAKATALEEVRLYGQARRQKMREAEAERKRAIFEEIEVMPSGDVQIITRNLSLGVKPRKLTNARKFVLRIFERQKNPAERIFKISAVVGGREREVFFKEERAGRANYLIQKFGAVGISFYAKPGKLNGVVLQLLSVLLERAEEPVILPDEPGWNKKSDGEWHFVEKEEATWTKLRAFCK